MPLTSDSASSSRPSEAEPPVIEHSAAQLWLQEQLSRVPMFQGVARHLGAGAAAAAAAAVDVGAASTSVAVTVGSGQGRTVLQQQQRVALQRPVNLSPQDQPLWDMFVEMDINGDGGIDEEELLSCLIKLGLPCSPTYVAQMMKQYKDSQAVECGTGKQGQESEQHGSRCRISWDEFKHYVNKRDKQIEAAFREFDVDGSGTISAFEIAQALVLAGLPTTGRDIRKVMEVMGKDVTDTISYQEFRKFACFMPSSQVKSGEIASYVGWLWNAPTLAAAARRRPPALSLSDPVQHFMAFDLMLRTSMAASLALMVVVALKME